MDDEDVDLNQDWFFEAGDQAHPVKQVPSSPVPIQNGGPGRGSGEYTALNVPLEDEFSAAQPAGMMQSSSRQVAYQQQQQRIFQRQDSSSNFVENVKYEEQQISSQQQISVRQVIQRPAHQQHERVLQQSENYNYPAGQQPPQQFQVVKSQQQADWDMMQTRPNSQMQMRPDSQMQMRPDSQMQMHNQQQPPFQSSQQQYFADQQSYNDPRNSNNQNFSNMPPIQQNQPVYKHHVQYASTSNNQFASATVENNGQFVSNQQRQQGGNVYVQQQSDGSQRLSGGMDQMMPMSQVKSEDSLAYNTTPPSTSKKSQNHAQQGSTQTGNVQKQRKAPPSKSQPQMVIQQSSQMPSLQPQMQSQFVNPPMQEIQAPAPSRPKKKPAKKAPTITDIENKFQRVGALSFDTREKSTEFFSILMELQNNPNATADERIAISDRLDKLLADADISEQAPQEPKPPSKSKSRKKPVVIHQTIEAAPPGYIPNQQLIFANQPAPQITTSSKVMIVECGNNVYTTTGPSTSYTTQIPIQQTQQVPFNNASTTDQTKKPNRKKPAKKGGAQQTVSIEGIPNVVQTSTNQIGQQILICTQSGTSIQNPPVMISYESIYPTPSSGGQQIILQYQPIPAVRKPLMETPKEIASKVKTAQENRENKVSKFFDDLHDKLENMDYITPFKNRADVADRLLPFAFNFEPNYSDEYIEKVDHETFRRFVHLEDRFKYVKNRLRDIYFEEAIGKREYDHELNMLLYLDGEYEKRQLENDKLEAKKDRDSFLRESEIIRAGIDSSELEIKKRQLVVPKDLVDPNTSSYGTYEYNDFDDGIFTKTETTPPPSPPKIVQKTKKKREKSRYLNDSDMENSDEEDSSEEEEDEEEQRRVKRENQPAVTELIDLNAIDTIDPEPDSMNLVRTPDAETLAANEQTEVIDKALDLLPHDLENVIPFVFTPEAPSKDFDLPINLQAQPSSNFSNPASKPSQQITSPLNMIPPVTIANAPVNFVPTTLPSQVQSNSSKTASPFDPQFRAMKTPPNQSKTLDFQHQISKFGVQKNAFVPDAQQLLKEVPQPTLSHSLPLQEPLPANIMKSPPNLLPKPGPSAINNNIVGDKFEKPHVQAPLTQPPLAFSIPKINAINTDKNPLLNPPILRPPVHFNALELQKSMNMLMEKTLPLPLPKPLEPAGAFDDPLTLLKTYQTPVNKTPVNQPSLKTRLLQAKPPKSLSELSPQPKQKTDQIDPDPSIPSKQPELAAVSMSESARLINSMKQKLQQRQNDPPNKQIEATKPLGFPIPPVNNLSFMPSAPPQTMKQRLLDRKQSNSKAGIEDSDDDTPPKPPMQTLQLPMKLGPPAPLDVTPTPHSLSLSRPSPSNALPVRLRFKFSNNNAGANGSESYAGFNQLHLPPPILPPLKPQEPMPRIEQPVLKPPVEAASVLPPPLDIKKVDDEKELKRKRKEEKKLRKEQKKLKKMEKKVKEEAAPPLKLKIRFGPKDEKPDQEVKSKFTAPPTQPTPTIAPIVEEPKVQGPPVKLKFSLAKRREAEAEKTELPIKPEKIKKQKKSKKRSRSPNEEKPPEPKIPRLKIKFGKEKTSEPPTPQKLEPKQLTFNPIPQISKPPPLTLPTSLFNSLPPKATASMKLPFSNVPPTPSSAMPLLTPIASTVPEFSDDELEDPNNDEQLKMLTNKLVSSLTKH